MHQHTLQPPSPAPMGLVPVFRASSCNLGQDCRERSCVKSPQAGVCLALWLILPLPPWFAFLAWMWPYLLAVPLPSHRWAAAHPSCHHQGCSAQLVGVLQDCAPTDTKLILREPDMWLFQALVSKNQTSSLSYRKNYCTFIKNLAGSCHLNNGVHHLGVGLFARISLNIIFNSSTTKSFLHHLDAISFWVQKSQSHFSEGFVGGGWFCWAKVVFLLNLHLK